MKRALVVLAVVVLGVTGVVGCSRAGSSVATSPTTMKTYFVAGAHTPEAVFLEIGWLELVNLNTEINDQ